MQQMALWLGPTLCALSVVAGAFGAHGLKARLTADSLVLWETAARYLETGIPLNEATLDGVRRTGAERGVDVDALLAG